MDTPPVGSLGRYARQNASGLISPEDQRKLGGSSVLLVGCGALGSPLAGLLVRAGVGGLVIADRDVVELHNLQSQQLYDENDVRERLPKAEAAARRLRAINSSVRVEALVADVTAGKIEGLAARADLILDGTDNLETRYLLNDAAVKLGKPWIYGGLLGTGGMTLTVLPGRGPCLRCLFPEPPAPGSQPTCDTRGVLNTAAAWVTAVQATEALKLLSGSAAEAGGFRMMDVWTGTVQSPRAERKEDCPCCGRRDFEFLDARRGSSATRLCGRGAVQIMPERPVKTDLALLKERLAPLGKVTHNGLLLEFTAGGRRLVVFPDGRVLVMGTQDIAEARSLTARYIGS